MALHEIRRLRHELRRRTLTVEAVEPITPQMVRITLSGDLSGFDSASYDDHVKLLLPSSDGADDAPAMREYTPRRFDVAAGELVIDFAIHEAGPATAWAVQAAPGQTIGIGGPRGSAVVPDDFDWYLLIGDETALPAIGRRLEELRGGVQVTVVAAVTGPEEEQAFRSPAALTTRWVHRSATAADDPAPVLAALDGIAFPPGDGFVWIGAEASVARALRAAVVEGRGHPLAWTRASGYWRRGEADASEKGI